MIFGIGTDIVDVTRIQDNLDRFGERFAARVLTADELDEFRRNGRPANYLARRFAVKEAVAKAFGTGFRDGLHLRDIGVGHDSLGRPCLIYSGMAQDLCRQCGITGSHVSIADERHYAVAFVTLVQAEPNR